MQYQLERFSDVIDEAQPLLVQHWEDVALNQDTVALNPDWDAYAFMDSMDRLHIITARDNGKLVGYVVYLTSLWLHYKDQVIADGDIFWLHPDYRKGMTGVKLLKEAENALRAKGVNFIINKVKLHKDVGKIFDRLGYSAVETVYSKQVL